MLGGLEKIQIGLSGCIIAGAIGLHAWQGTERWNTDVIGPPVPIRPDQVLEDPPRRSSPPAALARSAMEPERSDYRIQREVVAYIRREANYIEELDKAGSEILPGPDGRPTRLLLKDLDDDSVLKALLALEDGDIIEEIDGQRIEFGDASPAAAIKYRRRFTGLLERLEKGGRVSIAITRRGRPLELGFRL